MPGSASGLGKRTGTSRAPRPRPTRRPPCSGDCARCPGNRSASPGGNAAADTAGSRLAQISVVSLHPCPDLGGEFFPHAAQAIKVVRRRRALGSKKWTTVTVYAITSLTALPGRPDPAGPLATRALGNRGAALGS